MKGGGRSGATTPQPGETNKHFTRERIYGDKKAMCRMVGTRVKDKVKHLVDEVQAAGLQSFSSAEASKIDMYYGDKIVQYKKLGALRLEKSYTNCLHIQNLYIQ